MIFFIKKSLLKYFYLILNFWYFIKIKKYKNQIIYVLDIDNTLTINKLGFNINYNNPIPNKKVIDELREKINFNNSIFITARNYKLFKLTFDWLKTQNLINYKNQLLVVDSPQSKLKFIKKLIKQKNEIHYYDDLSYNHENGEIKLYFDVIEVVNNLPIKYFGLDYINKLSNEEDFISN